METALHYLGKGTETFCKIPFLKSIARYHTEHQDVLLINCSEADIQPC